MSNSKVALLETAKNLMALQSELQQRIAALECDFTVEPAEKHAIIDTALDLCSSMFSKMKESNAQYLEEMVPHGIHKVKRDYIAGVEIPPREYERVEKKAGYVVLNKVKDKIDSKTWAAILRAAAQTTPDVIQARITDSKVTDKFLHACNGLIGFKETSQAWVVRKASQSD